MGVEVKTSHSPEKAARAIFRIRIYVGQPEASKLCAHPPSSSGPRMSGKGGVVGKGRRGGGVVVVASSKRTSRDTRKKGDCKGEEGHLEPSGTISARRGRRYMRRWSSFEVSAEEGEQ